MTYTTADEATLCMSSGVIMIDGREASIALASAGKPITATGATGSTTGGCMALCFIFELVKHLISLVTSFGNLIQHTQVATVQPLPRMRAIQHPMTFR